MLICGPMVQMFKNIKYKIENKYSEVKFEIDTIVVQLSVYSSPKATYWEHTSYMNECQWLHRLGSQSIHKCIKSVRSTPLLKRLHRAV